LPILLCVCLLPACGVVRERDGAPRGRVDIASIPNAVPRAERPSKYGNPDSYAVYGKRYYTLDSSAGYAERGIASWYGTQFHGRRTSSGEPYDMYAMTAAHKSLPLPTYAEVTNLKNGRSVVVRVNDRGPFHENRLIDLSYVAALKLDIVRHGTGLVEVRAIDPRRPQQRVASIVPVQDEDAGEASRIFLQVGAFTVASNARRLLERLAGFDLPGVRIDEAVSDARKVYRVQVGPLYNVDTLDAIAGVLAAAGLGEQHVVIE